MTERHDTHASVQTRTTPDPAQTLRDELLYHHRATQTYLWALPLSTRSA